MNTKQLFKRDFTMVVLGQIISLFGNAILRFALPLYLLNQTGSAALFGVVSAISFIPMILLSPIGGIIADRINKRNIMVILDFTTAALAILYTVMVGKLDITALTISALILLYAIQGMYQPSVQASIPALVDVENLVAGNAVVTLVSSLASLLGPVIGGALFGASGIYPVMTVGAICFFASAVMEIFIHIPYEKKKSEGSVIHIAKEDMKESFRFIKNERPVIAKVGIYVALINAVFSALMIVGLPVIITQKLGFDKQLANQLYGYCEGALAMGGLLGGAFSGVLSKKIKVQSGGIWIYICAFSLFPIGLALSLPLSGAVAYGIILISCFVMMMASTVFSIQMMAYIQAVTPSGLIGKIMALGMGICMCASPIGQAIYGFLIEKMSQRLSVLFFVVMGLSLLLAFVSGRTYRKMEDIQQ